MIPHHPFLLVVVYLWHLLVVLFIVINVRAILCSMWVCILVCCLQQGLFLKWVRFFVLLFLSLDLGHFLVLIIDVGALYTYHWTI
jgi:hypothetical protein